MKLKYFKYILVGLITVLFACNKEQSLVPTNTDWNGTEFPISGGLLEITNPSIAYVVGNTGPYNIEFRVLQGSSNLTTKVDAYVTFHHFEHILGADGTDSLVIEHLSNKKLLATIDQNGKTVTHFDTLTFVYSDLVSDLTLDDGTAVPSQDVNLTIGDFFQFVFTSTVEDGNVYQNKQQAKATVSGRYAGKWHCTELVYFRIGSQETSYWKGYDFSFESVDATTYRNADWSSSDVWGPQDLLFKVDPSTLAITYPDGQSLNGQPVITLQSNYTDFSADIIPYAVSLGYPETTFNTVINDFNGPGLDRIILMYGYFTGGSGPRTFFEVYDKVE